MDKQIIEIEGAKFYTLTKTAETLGVTAPTLRKYIKKYGMKTTKLGRRVLIPPDEIKKILQVR